MNHPRGVVIPATAIVSAARTSKLRLNLPRVLFPRGRFRRAQGSNQRQVMKKRSQCRSLIRRVTPATMQETAHPCAGASFGGLWASGQFPLFLSADVAMRNDDEQLREVLGKIAKLLNSLSGNEDVAVEETDHYSGQRVCTPKGLPIHLQVDAARTAVQQNPVNAPAFNLARGFDDDVPTDPLRISVLTQKYWGSQQRKLSVSFLETTPVALRDKIIKYMNAWNKTAGISFTYTRGVGNVRISRGSGGFYSYVGTDILHIAAHRQTMNLEGFTLSTPDSEYRRVVTHEAGHTLGFPHEHMRKEIISRLDRQKCYAYFRRLGWSRGMVDSQVLTPLEQASIFATPTDETSIMCYQLPGSITKDGRPVLGGADINRTDYWFAGKIYPKMSGQRAAVYESEEDLNTDVEELEDEDAFVSRALEL